ncbi:Hexadecenal dehydrogenase [Recurvomyces mirabilis]|nr:Hexadecenal dehydrogenase [Recurvomyces mirabilis]
MIHLNMDDLPPFTATPEAEIPALHDRVIRKFNTHTTRPLAYRVKQLRQLYWGIKDAEPLLTSALQLDLGKSAFETYISEVGWCLNDILFMLKNVEKWMKDESAPDQSLTNKLMKPMIRKDPLGAVLVIGTWNFPINLTLGPLIGAIAAGCTAVVKPSEVSTNCSRVMQYIIENSLDPEAYQVVQGGIPETTAALKLKWDKIFYTGNAAVAKIISKAAAEHLTPVTLELGGKNPAIVSKNADTRLAARRLLWAKLFNAGQICISHNYTMVDKEVLPTFIHHLGEALQEFQPKGAKGNADYSRMVSSKQFHRVKAMLDNTHGKILFGGNTDETELFIEPTVIQVESAEDSLLVDESFGPLIPILPVQDLDEAIRLANEIHSTPLALYTFGTKAENARVLSQTRSGGASMNDSLFHASLPTLAFGGVGDSGSGAYRGKASFDTFTHCRSVTTTPGWMEGMLSVRYPPYTDKKLKQMKGMQDLVPDFDREGNAKNGGMVWWVLGLGSKGWSGAGLRWAVLMGVVAVLVRDRMSRL